MEQMRYAIAVKKLFIKSKNIISGSQAQQLEEHSPPARKVSSSNPKQITFHCLYLKISILNGLGKPSKRTQF